MIFNDKHYDLQILDWIYDMSWLLPFGTIEFYNYQICAQ